MSRAAQHRYQRRRHWSVWTRLAVGAGALVVVGGCGVVLMVLLGRPGVSVASSGPALFEVHLSGWGTRVVSAQATMDGRPIALVDAAGGLVPAEHLAQRQVVRVTVSARPPSWLRWLLGGKVSTTETLQTPAATPSTPVVLAPQPGLVPVSFDHPVSVVQYTVAGGRSHSVRLGRPSTVADIPVSARSAGGTLRVTAAPLAWEKVAQRPATVTWFGAPVAKGPAALADPAPASATAAPTRRSPSPLPGPSPP